MIRIVRQQNNWSLALKTLSLTAIVVILYSCTQTAVPKTTASVSNKAKGVTSLQSNPVMNYSTSSSGVGPSTFTPPTDDNVSAPAPVQIDASKLVVSNVSIGPLLSGGSRAEVVNFVASGPTQYIQWKLCPEEQIVQANPCVASSTQSCGLGGACVENVTPYNSIQFPHLFSGNVSLSLQACVQPSDALNPNQNCGPYTSIAYNSHVSNTQVTALFAKRQGILDELNRIGEQKKQLMINYRSDLIFCLQGDKKNAEFYEFKINVLDEIINDIFFKMWFWAPEALIKELDKIGAIHHVLEGVRSAMGSAKEAIIKTKNKICSATNTTGIDTNCMTALKDSNSTMTLTQQQAYCRNSTPTVAGIGSFCNMIGTLAHAIGGFVEMMNPATSLTVLADAVQTVMDPQSSVSRTCLAEQKLANSSQAIDQEVAALTQQLMSCDSQLRALGEL